jgi:hypothetical protein
MRFRFIRWVWRKMPHGWGLARQRTLRKRIWDAVYDHSWWETRTIGEFPEVRP